MTHIDPWSERSREQTPVAGVKIIGVTGGVGSGKTEVLHYIGSHYRCIIILSDLVAKKLQEPGQAAFEPLLELLGREILDENGCIDKGKMADRIFHSSDLLIRINELLHPMVIDYILQEIQGAKESEAVDYVFVEAALLIENGFDQICDELWYIYASESVRRQRLKASRGYTEEKITAIMGKQLSEDVFRSHCQVIIDNSGSMQDTEIQISNILDEKS